MAEMRRYEPLKDTGPGLLTQIAREAMGFSNQPTALFSIPVTPLELSWSTPETLQGSMGLRFESIALEACARRVE